MRKNGRMRVASRCVQPCKHATVTHLLPSSLLLLLLLLLLVLLLLTLAPARGLLPVLLRRGRPLKAPRTLRRGLLPLEDYCWQRGQQGCGRGRRFALVARRTWGASGGAQAQAKTASCVLARTYARRQAPHTHLWTSCGPCLLGALA